MKLPILLLLICFLLPAVASSQLNNEFSKSDLLARTAPDSIGRAPALLADYFRSRLNNPRDLIRAIYCWTATHIAYDVENMYTTNTSDNPASLIMRTLTDRKAVCQGYAEVFRELCTNCGIQSYVVHGYTRNNGVIASLPHAWDVAVVDGQWYFFDPTWAAGYVENRRFVKRFTGDYFMVSPARNILSHMPYDPMWQCLYLPFTSSDFYNGKKAESSGTEGFSFPDSIAAYMVMPVEVQSVATLRRMEKNGIVNNSLFEYARYLRQNIEIYHINKEIDIRNREIERQRQVVDRFNRAANYYNNAVRLFNDYINYYNRQFKPARPDGEIRQMVDTCDRELARAAYLLKGVPPEDENLKANRAGLADSILDLEKKVNDQKLWLTNYLGTSKPFRSSQFKKYTIFGVPVN